MTPLEALADWADKARDPDESVTCDGVARGIICHLDRAGLMVCRAICVTHMTEQTRAAIKKIDEIIEGQKRENQKPFTGNTYSPKEALLIVRDILTGSR